jgi:hypothetical protein
MELSLSRDEALVLKQALDIYLKEFEFEVARTERSQAVHDLNRSFGLLQVIRERIDRGLTEPALPLDQPSIH